MNPPDEELEVGEITVFVEGAGEAPTCSRPGIPVYNGTRPTPPYAVMCEAFPREPTWCPALPPATHAPCGWASPHLSPPLSRTRGAHHRGQILWQERPGTPLLLLVVMTRQRIRAGPGNHPHPPLRGSARAPPPPPGARGAARDARLPANTGRHRRYGGPPSAAPLGTTRSPQGPGALRPTPDWELWRDVWDACLNRLPPQCCWMTTGPCLHGANTTAGPPCPPPPPAEHCTALPTAHH